MSSALSGIVTVEGKNIAQHLLLLLFIHTVFTLTRV